MLLKCMAHQTPTEVEHAHESLLRALDFRTADVEGFRYRVENALRAVTPAAVKEVCAS